MSSTDLDSRVKLFEKQVTYLLGVHTNQQTWGWHLCVSLSPAPLSSTSGVPPPITDLPLAQEGEGGKRDTTASCSYPHLRFFLSKLVQRSRTFPYARRITVPATYL